jgi:hypothetical protein
MSQGTSVSIVTRLRAGLVGFGLIPRCDNKKIYFLCHHVQTGCGAHPTSYSKANEAPSPGIKLLRHEAHQSPSFSAKTKKVWSYTSTHLYVFMVWCLIKQATNLHGVVFS